MSRNSKCLHYEITLKICPLNLFLFVLPTSSLNFKVHVLLVYILLYFSVSFLRLLMSLLQPSVQVLPWRLYNTDINPQGLAWGTVKGTELRTCITAWEQWLLFKRTPSGQFKLSPCPCPVQQPPFQHKCWVKYQDWFEMSYLYRAHQDLLPEELRVPGPRCF